MENPPERQRKSDWYWPLAALEYEHEIEDSYSEEAQLLGAIMILWNRQELALRDIFVDLLNARQSAYAEAIWDRQPTHQARRDLLALALRTVRLSKRNAAILTWVIDQTKTLADRRNELIHAEYVVQHRTSKLHAKVSPPRSNKPPKLQPTGETELRTVLNQISLLLRATEGAHLQLSSRMKAAVKKLELGPHPKSSNPTPRNK